MDLDTREYNMKRLDDDDIDRLTTDAINFAENGSENNLLGSIAISNLVIIELLTRIVEK